MDNIALPVAMVATLVLAGMTADHCKLITFNFIEPNCINRTSLEERFGRCSGIIRAVLPLPDAQGALAFSSIVF